MKDIKEFYILGLPIQTELGNCHFLKVRDYPDYFMDLQALSLTKQQLIYKYEEINQSGQFNQLIEELKNVSLFQIIASIPELGNSYHRLFTKVFKDRKVVSELSENNFMYYRKLVMEMNCVKEEVINPNPEIQRAIERSRRVKATDGDKLEFSDIVSSVIGFNGLTYENINQFTMYQLYMTYYRIAQIKNYDTTTLFATVSSDKIKIDSWSKHINLFEEEKHFISHQEFKSKTNSVFEE